LRDLVAHGALLARWRGTPYGMRTALELATGVTGFVLDEPPERPFHLVVRVPPAAADRLALVTRIVEAEKPAAVTVEVLASPVDAEPADPVSATPSPPPDSGPPEPDTAEPAAGVAAVRAVGRAHVPAPLPHDPPEEPS
ncbi:phage tail protein, partial [Micromonospora aurantiaca]